MGAKLIKTLKLPKEKDKKKIDAPASLGSEHREIIKNMKKKNFEQSN